LSDGIAISALTLASVTLTALALKAVWDVATGKPTIEADFDPDHPPSTDVHCQNLFAAHKAVVSIAVESPYVDCSVSLSSNRTYTNYMYVSNALNVYGAQENIALDNNGIGLELRNINQADGVFMVIDSNNNAFIGNNNTNKNLYICQDNTYTALFDTNSNFNLFQHSLLNCNSAFIDNVCVTTGSFVNVSALNLSCQQGSFANVCMTNLKATTAWVNTVYVTNISSRTASFNNVSALNLSC
jgi:hypothetical protein